MVVGNIDILLGWANFKCRCCCCCCCYLRWRYLFKNQNCKRNAMRNVHCRRANELRARTTQNIKYCTRATRIIDRWMWPTFRSITFDISTVRYTIPIQTFWYTFFFALCNSHACIQYGGSLTHDTTLYMWPRAYVHITRWWLSQFFFIQICFHFQQRHINVVQIYVYVHTCVHYTVHMCNEAHACIIPTHRTI